MDFRNTSLKTFVGLPVILLFATGIAFGATKIHDSLLSQSPSTLTADEVVENTNQENSSSSQGQPLGSLDAYTIALTEISQTLRPRYAQRAALGDNTPQSSIEYENIAATILETACWLWKNDAQASKLPAGPVRHEFQVFMERYNNPQATRPVCESVRAEKVSNVINFIELDDEPDGLSYVAELLFATNYLKADTDGDGFSDLDEINNGYSPLVPSVSR